MWRGVPRVSLCCVDVLCMMCMQEVYIFRSFANKYERMFLKSCHSIYRPCKQYNSDTPIIHSFIHLSNHNSTTINKQKVKTQS